MGSVTARITQNQALYYAVQEHSQNEDTWQHILTSVTTSNGLVNGSTMIDADRVSGGANTWNGRYWVRIKSGNNKGLWRRIVDDFGSANLYLEGYEDSVGLPSQVVSGTEYELWKSPEPVVVITSATNATQFADTERNEANDFWEGYYLVAISGALRGEKAQVTGFTSASGEFIVGSGLSGTPSVGDVFLICRYIDVTSINNGLTQAFNARPMNRLDGSKGDGSIGVKSGTFGFDVPALGVWRNGSSTVGSILGGLLTACGFEEVASGVAAGSTTPSTSTTTQLEVDTATWESYSIGAAVSVNGEQAFITALGDGGGTDDNITITPALAVGAQAGVTVCASVNYRRNRRNDDGDYNSVTIVHEVDGIRTIMTGCKGNLTISGEDNLTFGFEFQVDNFIRDYAPSAHYPGDAYETFAPVQSTDRRCYFGATAVELGGISASLNNTVSPRSVQGGYGANGRAGFAHTGVNPSLTCRKLMSTATGEELDADERWFSRTSHDLMIFWGNSLYGNCALRMPVCRLVQEPKPEDQDGIQATPFVFEAMEAGTTTDPDGTLVKIPDFIISFS